MIKFSNWNIEAIGQALGRQFDNLTRSIDVIGDLPDGWVWAALLEFGENLNIISLTPGEIGLHADLTADMLAFKGNYRLQLRGTDGVKVRHTNIITVAVSESISGDAKWPEVPSEFSQLEQRVQGLAKDAQDAVEQAENARDQYPKIISGNWNIYDPKTGEYVDTGVYAGGDAPYIGENGNWFVGNVDTGVRAQGEPGAPGKTPERGVDYWTPGDKQEIISEVLDQVPSGSEIDDTAVSAEKTWSSKNIVEKLAPAFESSGPVVTCNPVEGYPLHVVSQIVPVQEGEGDPSPENVRPISGWDAANLLICSENLFNPDNLSGGQLTELNGMPVYQYKDGSNSFSFNVPVIKNQVFTFVFKLTGSESRNTSIRFHYDDGSVSNSQISDGIGPITKTSDSKKTLIKITGSDSFNTTRYIDLTQTSLWLGNTSKDFEPYRGQTITLPFGQTVYVGTLDWTTGVLTVTHAEIASYAGEPLPGAWISDRDVYSQGTTPTTGAQVVYELSEPQTIQLTPTEILALSGTNTIYTDTGDTTVSGRSDPNVIIQQLATRIAALEGAATNL